jgi:predicted nucleotidyltransferase
MEITKSVSSWGNGGGVLLPREWIGNQVKVILIDRTLEIKREVLNILEEYLPDIIGLYLVGSYARGDQENESDIDIIAISNKTNKELNSGRYSVSIITLEGAKKTLDKNPVLILPSLMEAKAIINNSLLQELKSLQIRKNSFKGFIEECKRIIKIDKGLISLDKEQGYEKLDSISVIYSSILRLRAMFMISNIIKKERYSKYDFLKWAQKDIDKEEFRKAYNAYKSIRDDKKVKETIKIETAQDLLRKLEKEVSQLEKWQSGKKG